MTAIIFNPTARGDHATAFRARLNEAVAQAVRLGRRLELRPTRGPGDAVIRARDAVAEGETTVVAAGGDGTVNEVVNGLAQIADGPARCRLAVLPLGTVNVFAKELEIPADFDAAWSLLTSGSEREVDLATADPLGRPAADRANPPNVPNAPNIPNVPNAPNTGRRWFVQMAGAGLDSVALSKVSWELKKRTGSLAYVWAGVQAVFSRLPQLEAEIDGQCWRGQWGAIGNGRFYGGRWVVFPEAHLDDRLLDLALVERISVWGFPAKFFALASGRFRNASGMVHRQGREIILRPAAGERQPVPFHVEGDNVGFLPAKFSLDPRRLRVLVPRIGASEVSR